MRLLFVLFLLSLSACAPVPAPTVMPTPIETAAPQVGQTPTPTPFSEETPTPTPLPDETSLPTTTPSTVEGTPVPQFRSCYFS